MFPPTPDPSDASLSDEAPESGGVGQSRLLPESRFLRLGKEVAGVGAIIFATAFVLGWVFRTSYYNTLDVPLELIQFDPIATAIDALPVSVVVVVFASWALLSLRILPTVKNPRLRNGILEVVGFSMIIVGLVIFLATRSTPGWSIAALAVLVVGGMFILSFVSEGPAARLYGGPNVIAFRLALIAVGIFTLAISLGSVLGEAAKDSPGDLTVVTNSQVSGLESQRTAGCQWLHRGLFLIAVSEDAVLVGVSGRDGVWAIDRDLILTMAILRSPDASVEPTPIAPPTCATDQSQAPGGEVDYSKGRFF